MSHEAVKRPVLTLFALSVLVGLPLANCVDDTEETQLWSPQKAAEFNQLLEKYARGTATSAELARFEQLGQGLRALAEAQNAALEPVYRAGLVVRAPPSIAKELEPEEVRHVYFVLSSPDSTRWIALWGRDNVETGPLTRAYFGFKEPSGWKTTYNYITFTPGSTMKDARLSYFRTLMKDLGFFQDFSVESNSGFWRSKAIEDMRQDALEGRHP